MKYPHNHKNKGEKNSLNHKNYSSYNSNSDNNANNNNNNIKNNNIDNNLDNNLDNNIDSNFDNDIKNNIDNNIDNNLDPNNGNTNKEMDINNNQYNSKSSTEHYLNGLGTEIKSFKAAQFKKLENHEGRIKTLEYGSQDSGNSSPNNNAKDNAKATNNDDIYNYDHNINENNINNSNINSKSYNRSSPYNSHVNNNINNNVNNNIDDDYNNNDYSAGKTNRAESLSGQRPILSTKTDYYSSSLSGRYKRDLKNYLTKGVTPGGELELSSAKEGFPLRGEVIDLLENYLDKLSPMRKIASVDKISSDYATYVISKDDIKAKWVDEYNANDGLDFNEDILSINIYTHEMYTQPNISKRVLEDQIVNIEKWIIEQAALAFIKRENQDFLYGDGVGKPFGFLYYNMLPEALEKFPEIKTAKPGEVSLEDLENLFYSLPSEYDGNGTFLLSKALIHRFRTLKYEQTGQYIWQPSLKEGNPDTLLGIPVVASDNMPKVESGKIAIAFADFKRAYKIIDRIGMTILRDPYSHKPYISFYITKRIGADVIEKKAAVLLRVS